MEFDDWIDHFIFLGLPYPGYDAPEDDSEDNEDQLSEGGYWQQSSPDDSDTFEGYEFATEEEKRLLESCYYDTENCGASTEEQYLEFFGSYASVKRGNDDSIIVYYDVLDLSEMSLKLLEAVKIRKEKSSTRSCVHVENRRRWRVAESDTDSSSDTEESPEGCAKCVETAAKVETLVGGEQKLMEFKEDIKSVRATVMSWMRQSLQATFPDHLPRLPEEVLNMILEFTNVSNPIKFPFFDRRKDHWKFVKYEVVTKNLLWDLYSQITDLYLKIKETLFDYSGYPSNPSIFTVRFGEISRNVRMRVEYIKLERVLNTNPQTEEECRFANYIERIVQQQEYDLLQWNYWESNQRSDQGSDIDADHLEDDKDHAEY